MAKLYQRVVLYQRLKASVNLEDSPDFLAELLRFQKRCPRVSAALRAKEAGQPYNEQDYKTATDFAARFQSMSDRATCSSSRPPPAIPTRTRGESRRCAAGQLPARRGQSRVMAYAGARPRLAAEAAGGFQRGGAALRPQLARRSGPQLLKCRVEAAFNQAQPFYSSMVLYVLAFLLAVVSWLKWPDVLQRSAFWLMALAFVASTAGISPACGWRAGRR